MKTLTFHKMHGCGNDYIYIDAILKDPLPRDKSDIVRRLSDRHFGIGGDGVVFILSSKRADFRMRMFNQDGSEAEMCGNAIRCVGKYLYDFGYTTKTTLKIATKAGVKTLWLHIGEDNKVQTVSVDMGTVTIANDDKNITKVNVGNPHEVKHIFPQELDQLPDILHPWNTHANNEWAALESMQEVRMRVWERGTGETLACGTGAVAVAATVIERKIALPKISVSLPGGTLQVERLDNGHYILTGPATYCFKGTICL